MKLNKLKKSIKECIALCGTSFNLSEVKSLLSKAVSIVEKEERKSSPIEKEEKNAYTKWMDSIKEGLTKSNYQTWTLQNKYPGLFKNNIDQSRDDETYGTSN